MNLQPLRAPMTERELARLAIRNIDRQEQARVYLGERWLLHPSNWISRGRGVVNVRERRSADARLILFRLFQSWGAHEDLHGH